MAQAETLKEFLVSIGYTVDSSSERKFETSITKATISANLMAKALEEVGKVVFEAFPRIAENFERLYYISQRTGTSVENIRALGDAFRRMGLDVQDAVGATEALARTLRTQPGMQGLARSYGIDPKNASVPDVVEKLKARFGNMPYGYATAAGQAARFGIPENVFKTAWDDPAKVRQEIEESKKARGPNQDENAKTFADFGRQWADFVRQVETPLESLSATIAKPLTEALDLATKNGLAPFIAGLGTLLSVLVGGSVLMGVGRLLAGGAAAGAAGGVGAALGGGALGWFARAFPGVAGAVGLGYAADGGGHVTGDEHTKRLASDPAYKQDQKETTEYAKKGGIIGSGWRRLKSWFGYGDPAADAAAGGQETRDGGSKNGGAPAAGGGSGRHPILDLITRAEGTNKRGYDDSFDHQVKGALTDKSLDEVDAIQKTMSGSSAVGKYQFMRKTLAGLRNELGLTGQEKFDPALQDRLALSLYQRRMKQAARKGGTDEEVLDALAQEWASFPTRNGGGYYRGQHASVSREDVLAAVREESRKPAPAAPSTIPYPAPLRAPFAPTNDATLSLPDFSRAHLAPAASAGDVNITVHQGDVNTTVHGTADADMLTAGIGRRRRVLDDDLMRSLQGNVR